jgi:uncharacterized protein (DUF4415 family)
MVTKLSARQIKELEALAAMPDDQVDYGDIPAATNFEGARRGVFYRPIKEQVTLRLDADLLHHFRSQGEGYQTRINAALRVYVKEHG